MSNHFRSLSFRQSLLSLWSSCPTLFLLFALRLFRHCRLTLFLCRLKQRFCPWRAACHTGCSLRHGRIQNRDLQFGWKVFSRTRLPLLKLVEPGQEQSSQRCLCCCLVHPLISSCLPFQVCLLVLFLFFVELEWRHVLSEHRNCLMILSCCSKSRRTLILISSI